MRLIVVLPDDDRDECKEHRIEDAYDCYDETGDLVMLDELRFCKRPTNEDVTATEKRPSQQDHLYESDRCVDGVKQRCHGRDPGTKP